MKGMKSPLVMILCCACVTKKPNLILNVDGFIGVAFVDLLRTCGGFTR